MIVAVVGVTVTATRRCLTVIVAVSANTPTAATIRAVPGSLVVIMPVSSIDTTLLSSVVHSMRVSEAPPVTTAVASTLSPSMGVTIGLTMCIAVTSKFESGPGYRSISS